MDTIIVLYIFIFGEVDVHGAVAHAVTAVDALFQIASDQHSFESEPGTDILKDIKESGIGTQETAEETLSEQPAYQDDCPDDDSGDDEIRQTAQDQIGTKVHEERAFSEHYQNYGGNQNEVLYFIESLFIEEGKMFEQAVFSASQAEKVLL